MCKQGAKKWKFIHSYECACRNDSHVCCHMYAHVHKNESLPHYYCNSEGNSHPEVKLTKQKQSLKTLTKKVNMGTLCC